MRIAPRKSFAQYMMVVPCASEMKTAALPIGSDTPARILMISDVHLGSLISPSDAIDLFMVQLASVLAREHSTHLLILGDLVNGTYLDGSKILNEVLTRISKLGIPTHMIGGNHDRGYLAEIINQVYPNITLHSEHAMLVETKGDSPTKVFITHDMWNNYRVRGPIAFSFFLWIRSVFKNQINERDWLVFGHAHIGTVCAQNKIACVGQFSPEQQSLCYSVMTMNGSKIRFQQKTFLNDKFE